MSSGVISADFLFNVEKEMQILNELGYLRMLEDLWYPKVLRVRPMEGKSERLIWLLSTASIEQTSPADGGENGGNISYDELSTVMTEYFPAEFKKGYKINKIKYLNMRRAGIDPPTRWAADIGIYGAYLPQRLLSLAILQGGSTVGYDGVTFFNAAHPVHPNIPGLGSFANDFTGAISGGYPGALPIDDTVPIDTALTNLGIALSYISGAVPQPNGQGDPRNLEPAFMLYPPRMTTRVNELLNADFIPQVASSGAGSGDIKSVWKKFRTTDPVKVNEFDGHRSYTVMGPAGTPITVTGDDKTYYIVAREAQTTELGAFVETRRLPFQLTTYSGESGTEGVDAVLGRSDDLEWQYKGWTSVNPGHPFTIFKFRGS